MKSRSAAAKRGWATRRARMNPYSVRGDSDFSTDFVHSSHLPNITLYKPHLRYGGELSPPELNLSSGHIRNRADLNEFITMLRKAGKSL